MRKTIVVSAAVLMLAACASPQQQAAKEKSAAVGAWIAQNEAPLRAGTIKKSDYYQGLYSQLSVPPISPAELVYMRAVSGMITAAKKREAGEISADDYDARRREASISMQEGVQRIQAQDAQRRREDAALLLQTGPVTTHCSSYGGSTSCTSW